MADELTVIQKYEAIVKMNPDTKVPFDTWRCFGERQKHVHLSGTQICLGEDYVTIEEARQAVKWYVEQLGGFVKWNKI